MSHARSSLVLATLAAFSVGCGRQGGDARGDLTGAVVHVSEVNGRRTVQVVAASGGPARLLAEQPGGDLYPGPASPDGRWLSLIAASGDTEATHREELWVTDLSRAGTPRRLLASRRVRNPTFAPDGRSIVVETDLDSFSDLHRVSVEGGAPVRLTAAEGGSFQPWFLPDGQLLFTSSRSGIAQIYRMSADGASTTRLTHGGHEDLAPMASPDGSLVLFTSGRDGRDRLSIMRADGTDLRPLHEAWPDHVDEVAPTWSPDGRHVAYLARRAQDTRVWVTEVATGARNPVGAEGAREDQPVFSPDGRHILYVSGTGANTDLHVARIDGTGRMQLTREAGAEWLPRWLPAPPAAGPARVELARRTCPRRGRSQRPRATVVGGVSGVCAATA